MKCFACTISLTIVCCLAVGCSEPALQQENAPIVNNESGAIGTAELPTLVPTDNADETAADTQSEEGVVKEDAEQEKETTLASSYEPPFPDRTDLFKMPKREGRSNAVTAEGIEKAIELVGFVNVDSPQVVLSIDGMVASLEEGSILAEIEVISIQPPSVVLQRGRQRWQASLDN